MLLTHRMSHEAHYGNLPIMSKNVFVLQRSPSDRAACAPLGSGVHPGDERRQSRQGISQDKKVELAGFEPATPCLQSRCSTN